MTLSSLNILLCILVSPISAFVLPSNSNSNSNSKSNTRLQIAIDLPLDTFGDVNGDSLFDHEYYHNDAAQTIFPYLDQWRRTPDGSLVGIVSNHPTYQDGQAIATSQLEIDSVVQVAEENIVTTITGTQYLLGQELIMELDDWRLTGDGCVQGTLTQSYPHLRLKQGQKITTDPFALDSHITQNGILTTETGDHYLLLEAHVFPVLEQWKRLEGGSLAGYVYRHGKIADGDLITTSPLVELDESQDGLVLVTTATGSQYELGEPEPPKQFDEEEEEEEEEYYEEEEPVAEDVDYEYSQEEEEVIEEDIPTKYLPSNPVQSFFASAFAHQNRRNGSKRLLNNNADNLMP